MKIAISSGKGGTGKTFIATNLAVVAAGRGRGVTYLDCDVEAPNGHLFLKPEVERTERVTVRKPMRFDEGRCTACGKCEEVCRFGAISCDGQGNGAAKKTYRIDPIACEGCGVCAYFCPPKRNQLRLSGS